MIQIPEKCYALNNMTINPKTKIGEVIEVRAFETGYYRTTHKKTQAEIDKMNESIGVGKATARAMYDASVFGWQIYYNCLKSHKEREAKQKA